jgi:hypothetical protein
VAEDFVVENFVKPAVLRKMDINQFGTIPKSSTIHALISMILKWKKQTDGSGSMVRVVLFDFKKVFDLIDHVILVDKLTTFEIPKRIIGLIFSKTVNSASSYDKIVILNGVWFRQACPEGPNWILGFLL